jgi:hypothetical protein
MKIVRPSPSYLVTIPDEVLEDHGDRVASFWLDGEEILLQLSSYIRADGQQPSAATRLRERIAKHAENWTLWNKELYPAASVDQATAEFVDHDGVLWIHTYLVWPHLTIYALISGPDVQVRSPSNWAMASVKSIELAIH